MQLMNTTNTEPAPLPIVENNWNRCDTAQIISDFETKDPSISQRGFAEMYDVP